MLDNQQVGLNLPPPIVDPDDPLLIAQTLTYVTDDGSVLLSFTSAPFSFGELQFIYVVYGICLLYGICSKINCWCYLVLLIYYILSYSTITTYFLQS